jgi:hypothetical protein
VPEAIATHEGMAHTNFFPEETHTIKKAICGFHQMAMLLGSSN